MWRCLTSNRFVTETASWFKREMDLLKTCARISPVLFRGRRTRFRALALFALAVVLIQFVLIHIQRSPYRVIPHCPETTDERNRIRIIKKDGLLYKRLINSKGNFSDKLVMSNGQTFAVQILSRNEDKIVVRLKGMHAQKLWKLSKHRPKDAMEPKRAFSHQKEETNTTARVVERKLGNVQRNVSSHYQQQNSWKKGANNKTFSHQKEKTSVANITTQNVNKETFKIKKNSSSYLQEQTIRRKRSDVCPNSTLYTINQLKVPYGICQPHRPTQAACKLARQLYNENTVKRYCKVTQGTGDICHIEADRKGKVKKGSIIVRCRNTICSDVNKFVNRFRVKIFDSQFGETKTVKKFETVEKLEKGLAVIIKNTTKNKFYFVFVLCRKTKSEWLSQLLPIDPRLTIHEADSQRDPRAVNVNIILIDSVARAHFYRSLPRTVKTFQSWVDQPSNAPATVLDFELFQAVYGHTNENTQALFAGTFINPNSSGAVEMGVLFGHYKKAGYQTTWQEDLCYKGVWGLRRDLKAHNWGEMQKLSKKAQIDSTGLTYSSCEVLRANGEETPFNGPEGDQICYNGKFQHTYLTGYLRDTLTAIQENSHAKPILSYTALNVGHDYTGRRIQTLDNDLADLVTALAHQNNTLTIIMADHGNTYAKYTSSILEGRFEMFHPSLFVVVPDNVARLLGNEAMAALKINQRRLVTAFDLHHSLMSLAGPLTGGVKHVGIFTPINSNRTCSDIKLKTPNRCLCEGWDIPTTNDSFKIALAEFAVGELNNAIQDQLNKGHDVATTKTPSCQRIEPIRFENVRESSRNSKLDGSLVTTMDIIVRAGDVVNQKEEVFQVQVRSHELSNQISMELKLLNFERLTLYGKYKQCADEGVSLKLCICSSKNIQKRKSDNSTRLYKNSRVLGQPPYCESLNRSCLFMCKRNHNGRGKSFAIEIANFCLDTRFTLRINTRKVSNIKLSRDLPFDVELLPGDVRFVLSGRRDVPNRKTKIITSAVIIDVLQTQNLTKGK